MTKSDANRKGTINISNLNKKYTTEWQCGTELLAWIDWSLLYIEFFEVKKKYINLIYHRFKLNVYKIPFINQQEALFRGEG